MKATHMHRNGNVNSSSKPFCEQFAEVCHDIVFAELANWRAELFAGMGSAKIDRQQLIRFVVTSAFESKGRPSDAICDSESHSCT